jgi:hypothetical protein
MNNLIATIFISLMSVTLAAQSSYAGAQSSPPVQINSTTGWVTDYRGDLGGKEIGLAIFTSGASIENSEITNLHYFYVKHLQDISLKLKKRDGRNISFDEYDNSGKLVGTFNLRFLEHDPKKHFSGSSDLNQEVLAGSWNPANGKSHYPVYLLMQDSVESTGNGGRCYLDGQAYQQLQEKIQKFYVAVMRDDTKTLKRDFYFSIPESPHWKKLFAEAVPHDLFCNYQGYMLGSGIVWFDSSGKVIAVNFK